jgi:hypothetical protein
MPFLAPILLFLSNLAWPVVILVLVGWRFRSPLSDVLKNFKAKTPFGEIEHTAQQEAEPKTDPLATTQTSTPSSPNSTGERGYERYPLTTPEGRLIALIEAQVNGELATRNYSPEMTRDVLLYALASRHLEVQFERVYIAIYGSQFAALDALTQQANGAEIQFLQHYYDQASLAWPNEYSAYAFTSWLGFMTTWTLIEATDGKYRVSDFGIAFLHYVMGRSLTKLKAL